MLELVKTKTIKDTAIVTAGMGLSTLLSAVSVFLIARLLNPTGFGVYVFALAIAVILTDSLELAISNSLVKFASGSRQSQEFIKFGFYLKLFTGLGLGILLAIFSRSLANLIQPQLTTPLLLAAGYVTVLFFHRFPRSVLQAQKRFMADMAVECFTSLMRLALILIFYIYFKLTVTTALLAYVLGAFLAFILGARLISWEFLQIRISPNIRTDFFRFQKWLTLGFIAAAVHGRIDSLLLIKFSGPEATGIYQAAYRFFMPVIQLAAALSLVFAPRFSGFDSPEKSRIYLHKAVRLSLSLAGLSLLIIPFSPLLVQLIFGQSYKASIPTVRILALGFAAFIGGAPFVSHLIYSSQRTKLFFGINLLQLFLLTGLDIWLLPRWGSLGAAWAMSLTLIVINGLLAGLAYVYTRQG